MLSGRSNQRATRNSSKDLAVIGYWPSFSFYVLIKKLFYLKKWNFFEIFVLFLNVGVGVTVYW